MADFLLPQANISIEDQKEVFSIRCKTNNLEANRGILEFCNCQEIRDNPHIFKYKNLNFNTNEYDIKCIINGYTKEKPKKI